jgi:hypothetical protein
MNPYQKQKLRRESPRTPRTISHSNIKTKSPFFRGIFVFLDKINNMFFKSKKRKEEEEDDKKPLPVLCATVCVVWNTEEEIEANPGQGLYTDSVPIIFDITKVAAIQADVEFRNDGSASIGSRTLIYITGSTEPLIIDAPYQSFVEYFTLLKSNEFHNNANH